MLVVGCCCCWLGPGSSFLPGVDGKKGFGGWRFAVFKHVEVHDGDPGSGEERVNNVLNMAHRKVCPLGMQSTSDELQTLLPLSGQIMSCTNSFPVTILSPTTLLFVLFNPTGRANCTVLRLGVLNGWPSEVSAPPCHWGAAGIYVKLTHDYCVRWPGSIEALICWLGEGHCRSAQLG